MILQLTVRMGVEDLVTVFLMEMGITFKKHILEREHNMLLQEGVLEFKWQIGDEV